MRYPYQNFIYYLIMLGLNAEQIHATLKQWRFPFLIEHFDKIKEDLYRLYPEASKVTPKNLVYEPWMEPLGLQVLTDPSLAMHKSELEDMLLNSDLRKAVSVLLILGDGPDKIVGKLAHQHAIDVSPPVIEFYQTIFWRQDLSRMEWREYSKMPGVDSGIFHKLWTTPADEIEMEMGVCSEIPIEALLKRSIMILYVKFRDYMRNAQVGDDNLSKAMKVYNEFMKAIEKLDKKQAGADESVSDMLRNGLASAKKRGDEFGVKQEQGSLFEKFDLEVEGKKK